MDKITIMNKSTVTIHGLKPDSMKKIAVDENGTPLEKNWRRRLRDSAIDGAIVKVDISESKIVFDEDEKGE